MHPTLFQVGTFGLHTYGVSIAVGFIIAILLTVRTARRQGISVERILDLSFWILVSSLLGSRLLFILTEAPTYARLCLGSELPQARTWGRILFDCSRPLHLWEGGLVFFGGLLGATLASWIYTRRHQLDFLRIADLCAPVIALGHFFGRLGCFSAGCCYGKVTQIALGLSFPPVSVAHQEMVRDGLLEAHAPFTPPLFPTQLGEAFTELSLFIALLWVNQRKRFHGQTLITYLMIYPTVRFGLELFRGDPDRHYLITLSTPWLNRWLGLAKHTPLLLSTSQSLSLLLVVGAAVLWRHLRRKQRNS